MKRILTVAVIAVAAMVATFDVSAQTIGSARFGVFGGFTSARTRDAVTNILNYQVNRMPEYHAGITGQIPLGAAFSLQPSIAWHVKGSSLSGLTDLNGDLNYEALENGTAGKAITLPRILLCAAAAAAVIWAQIFFYKKRKKA